MTREHVLVLLLVSPLLLAQSLFLFLDARKRGFYPWLWGLWGLIQVPTPLIVYYLFMIRKIHKKWRKP